MKYITTFFFRIKIWPAIIRLINVLCLHFLQLLAGRSHELYLTDNIRNYRKTFYWLRLENPRIYSCSCINTHAGFFIKNL